MANPPGGSHPTAVRPDVDLGSDSSDPLARYERALRENRSVADELEGTARSVEVRRLLVFVAGAVAGLLHDETPLPPFLLLAVAGVCLVGFVRLVVRHRTLRRELRRARISETLARLGVLRLTRDWEGIADELDRIGYVDPMLDAEAADEDHPYAYDLDVFGPASVRALLGPTPTVTGTRTLRAWLSAPADPDEVRRRQSAVRVLAAETEARERVTGEALLVERVRGSGWEDFLAWAEGPSLFDGPAGDDATGGGPDSARGERAVARLPAWSRAFAWIAPATTLSLFGYWFVSVGVSPFVWVVPLVIQATVAHRWGRALHESFGRAGAKAPGLRRHHGVFAAWEDFATDETTLAELRARLGDAYGARASEEIRALGRLLDLAASAGSMAHGIISAILLWDVHVASALDRWRARAGGSVRDWFEALGELEALAALATLAHDQPAWCFPELRGGAAPSGPEGGARPEAGFEAEALGHPLLSDAVRRTSDVRLDPPGRFLLVTGSNMSGKSTLLRSIGLAAVMGQTGSVVCARAAVLTPLRTFTSMRIHDSLTGGVSLFMAELLRLKALVDAADRPDARPLLYLVDEVLQGTNSEERRVAARRIIRHLLQADAIGAVTTHDLALHEDPALDAASTKVHFREEVDASGDEVLTFDYRLRPGLATSRNALRLLRIVGLDPPAGDDDGGGGLDPV